MTLRRSGAVVALVVCACSDGGDVVSGDAVTVVDVKAGDEFGFVVKDGGGAVVGESASDPRCPPLSVALRLPDDDGSRWIDVTDPRVAAGPRDDVEVLQGRRLRLLQRQGRNLVGSVVLADDKGVDRGSAVFVVRDGAEGFADVDVSVSFDEADVAWVAACFALDAAEHVVGGGERFSGPDLKNTITPLVFSAPGETASGTNEAHVPVPFFATTRGLSVLVESERVGAFDVDESVPGALEVRFLGDALPLRLRAGAARDNGSAVERVTDNVAAHARRMGLPKAPPRWALFPMQWRNDLETVVDEGGVVVDSGTDMLNRDVDEMLARALPFAAVWIDAPWETGYNTFVFNEVQLPDIDDALARLDSEGFVPMVWATEHVNTSDDSDQAVGMPPFGSRELFERFAGEGFLVVDEAGAPFTFPWGRGQGAFVDFSNPAACDAWVAEMRPLLEQGVRGFKLDYGESMRPDVLGLVENTIPRFDDGSTNRVMHTRYARLYHECYIRGLEAVHGDDWFIITRTGGIFDQKNGVAIWPGDIDSDFSRFGDDVDGEFAVGGLPSAIGAYLSLSMSGYPLYGADIGGYRGDRVTPEAFSRWAEAASLSTIFQVGGGSNQTPWDNDLVVVVDEFARSARLKASLWPMFESWIARASQGGDGTPVVVPLGVFMGEDAEAWADREAFVVGGVLAAWPVVEDGARARTIRVPAGRWLRLSDASAAFGPATVDVGADLGDMPVFLRAGALLVLDEESQTSETAASRASVDGDAFTVVVAPGGDGAVFAAGVSAAVRDGDAGALEVDVEGAFDFTLTLRALGRYTAAVVVDGEEVEAVVDGDVSTLTTTCAPRCALRLVP